MAHEEPTRRVLGVKCGDREAVFRRDGSAGVARLDEIKFVVIVGHTSLGGRSGGGRRRGAGDADTVVVACQDVRTRCNMGQ